MLGTVGYLVSPVALLSGSVVYFVGLGGEGSALLGAVLVFAGLFGLWFAKVALTESFKIQEVEARTRREARSMEAEERRKGTRAYILGDR